jgi:N-acetylmuramoyl-L-alanine amidase
MMTTRHFDLNRLAQIAAVVGVLAPASAAAQTAQEQYAAATARYDAAIKQIAATVPTATAAERTRVITEARAVIAAYGALVRRYPSSGYSDNALFNAASLAEALHRQFTLTTDLDTALRLYRRLPAEYPHAPLAKDATAAIARLEPAAAAAAPAVPAAAASDAPPSTPASAQKAKLTAIDRTVLAQAVRVTLTLDREVPYIEETLTGPARVFFDLKGVEAATPLVDAVLRYPSDLVRQIRVGRHPSAIRVVLDLEGVSRHSVYTLYNPFRIVVDAEPPRAAMKSAPAAPTAVAVAPVPMRPTVRLEEPTPVLSVVESAAEVGAAPPPPPTPAPSAIAGSVLTPVSPPSGASSGKPVPPSVNSAGGFSIARQLGLGISRIVIDPGHGGHDPGAQSRGINEADLTLDVALRLEKLLLQEPGLEVVLTRRTDLYIPLEERTAIANREGADLFLSIHANTSRSTSARGVETYFLSFAGSADAEAVAARENSSHAGEMHKLPDIIKAITLNNKLDESRDLATMVQEALITRLRRSNKDVLNRGVKKAPFVVLIGAEMPSVLAEVSFMSNRQELQLLKNATYKQRIAEALHAAMMRYRRSLKGAAAVAAETKR